MPKLKEKTTPKAASTGLVDSIDALNELLERVKKAIANGEDRSNTDVEVDDGNGNKIPLLKSMHNRFNNFWYLLTAPNGISDFNREGIKVEVYES